ncbi:uncharacterized oxidoreductase dhs-27-like [Episyrphus balteatus]|uniref:uncharacterized oxidoreductase dhs-27-like n=1 Tax=Episyrphus balteatus TaxID=286459 RepID=UPI002485E0B7|nr:uncharacterized oxidoreductase dhs-27-like [Episyrphus balteatus]
MSDIDDESFETENWLVNTEWIQDFLKDHHKYNADFVLKDYTVSAGSSNGLSNLSEVLAVKIQYEFQDEKHQLELFIKLLPHDPFSRFFVTEAQFDLREIKFYTQILPDLLEFQKRHLRADAEPMTLAVPKCYHSTYNTGLNEEESSPEPSESILVLQDMRPMGYQSAHFTSGLTLEQTKYAIISISAVHALSLAMKFKEKVQLNEKYPFLFQIDKASDSYQQLVEHGLPHLSKFLLDIGGKEEVLKALNEVRNKTRSIIEVLLQPDEPMGLITHTDFWSNNLLLKNRPDPSKEDNCVILDWQMVTYSRATNDIALLMISSLTSDVRRKNTESLLDFYYDCLKKNLLKVNVDLEVDLDYSRQKLGLDYKKSQLLALLLCIGSVDIALGKKDAEERLIDALEDFNNDGVLNPYYLANLDNN